MNHVAKQHIFKITSVQKLSILVLKFKDFLKKIFNQGFEHFLKIRCHRLLVQYSHGTQQCRRYGGPGGCAPSRLLVPPNFGLLCFFLEHTQGFLGRIDSCKTEGKEQKSLQPPLAKLFRKYNPKKQAFKRVSVLTLRTYKMVEGARQFNSFNNFLIFAIYCNYSYGVKEVRTIIKIALKLLFFPQNHKNHRVARGFALRSPL